jgi:hypothetical protein
MEEVQAAQADPEKHQTSLAVWDVPSRTAMGGGFKIKVGAKCAASCKPTDWRIEVHDHTGTKVADARLGETPWPGTNALYWAEVGLPAPASEGVHSWAVGFAAAASGGDQPHAAASARFSFLTVNPPEHAVTVQVIDKETRTPVADAVVRVGPCRACTGEDGLATVEIAKGAYEVTVYKVDCEAFARAIEVNDNVAVGVELVFAPKLEDAYWG